LAFLGFPSWEVISDRSARYSAGFGGSLRGKLENFRTQITRMATDLGMVGCSEMI
jgi:hypothetical protein